jgi:hypothetical protein
MRKSFFRFGYTNPPREGHPRLHHSRDGAAFDELIDPLYSRGYRHGTFIHNYPFHRQPARKFKFLQPGDLVVTTTRPPLDDVLEKGDKDRRHIDRSEDALEIAIHQELRRFFNHLSRYGIILSPEMAALLPPEYASLAKINFHTRGKATIRTTELTVRGGTRTKSAPKGFNAIGIFIHLDKVSGFPCGFIASFSMGGYENLLWNRIVRLRYDQWFARPSFALALLNLPDEPPQPLTPMLADDARAKVLIEHWLKPDGQTEVQFSDTVPSTVTAKAKPSARASQSRSKPGKTRNAIPPSFSI